MGLAGDIGTTTVAGTLGALIVFGIFGVLGALGAGILAIAGMPALPVIFANATGIVYAELGGALGEISAEPEVTLALQISV